MLPSCGNPRQPIAARGVRFQIVTSARDARDGSACFFPQGDSALDVTRVGKSRLLRSLHRHRGAYAERAVEQKLGVWDDAELMKNSAGLHIVFKIGLGRMNRS